MININRNNSQKSWKPILRTFIVLALCEQIGSRLLRPSERLGPVSYHFLKFPYVSYSLSLIAHTECRLLNRSLHHHEKGLLGLGKVVLLAVQGVYDDDDEGENSDWV